MKLAFSPRSAVGHGWGRWMRSALRAARPPVRVVIYGEHSADWMAALAPGAPVWRRMPEVGEVLSIPDTPGAAIPQPRRRGILRTVVIPLMEDHTRHCPWPYASLHPDDRAIDVLANKAAFSAYVKSNGFADFCPTTYEDSADAVFPCVLKRVDLNSGSGVAIVHSPQELASRLEQEPWSGHPFILQSFAAGATEYVTHCVCRDGRILWHCSFAYESNRPDSIRTPANVTAARAVTAHPAVLSRFESLLSPLAYSGPCNIDHKISDGGKLIVFEINPRLGGSLMIPGNVEHLRGALSHIIKAARD